MLVLPVTACLVWGFYGLLEYHSIYDIDNPLQAFFGFIVLMLFTVAMVFVVLAFLYFYASFALSLI